MGVCVCVTIVESRLEPRDAAHSCTSIYTSICTTPHRLTFFLCNERCTRRRVTLTESSVLQFYFIKSRLYFAPAHTKRTLNNKKFSLPKITYFAMELDPLSCAGSR